MKLNEQAAAEAIDDRAAHWERLVQRYNGDQPVPPAPAMRAAAQEMVELQKRKSKRKFDPLRTKGFIAVMLNVTDLASAAGYPLDPERFFTEGRGQVRNQRGSRPSQILEEWQLPFRFGTESGGTSRGSIGYCEDWVGILNQIFEAHGAVGHGHLMQFWVEKAEALFAHEPVAVRFEGKQTLRAFVRRLIEEVRKKERETTGVKALGAVLQHMVGAKLELVLGPGQVVHHSVSQSDAQTGRAGDFAVGDYAIHVTTAPSEQLIRKCADNIRDGAKPIIVTLASKAAAADQLAQNFDLEDEIEIFEFEPFIVHNLVERALVSASKPRITVEQLVAAYNRIVDEQDPVNGVRISLAGTGQSGKGENGAKL